MKKRLSYSEKKAMHDRMWRLKICVTCDASNTYGLRINKKVYFRDKDTAEENLKRYQGLLDDAMCGRKDIVDIEGYNIKASIILAYEVKLREPKSNPETLPDKMGDDEDDDD